MPMARKLVIYLFILALALASGPAPFAVPAAADALATADRAPPDGDCCEDGDKNTERTCAIDGACLLRCPLSPNYLDAASLGFPVAFPMLPGIHFDLNEPPSRAAAPPFRPPRSSILA